MKMFFVRETRSVVTVGATFRGRLAAAFRAVCIWTPVSAGLMMGFFLADFLFDYSSDEKSAGQFWFFFVVVLGCVALTIGVVRLLRAERWTFDRRSREVRFSSSLAGRVTEKMSTDFPNVKIISLSEQGVRGRVIRICFVGDVEVVIAKALIFRNEVSQLFGNLKARLRKTLDFEELP